MDSDRIKGAAQEIGGKVQQGFGKLTGDSSTQAEGAARELGGKAQGAFGEAKEQVRHVVEDVNDYARDVVDNAKDVVDHSGKYVRQGAKSVASSIKDYPVIYLVAAAAVGFFASMLLSDHNDRRYYRR